MKHAISTSDSLCILSEMCKVIGLKYEDVDFAHPTWYTQHTWTTAQEKEFTEWLGKFLVKKKYAPKGKKHGINAGYYEAQKILFNYGWATKD